MLAIRSNLQRILTARLAHRADTTSIVECAAPKGRPKIARAEGPGIDLAFARGALKGRHIRGVAPCDVSPLQGSASLGCAGSRGSAPGCLETPLRGGRSRLAGALAPLFLLAAGLSVRADDLKHLWPGPTPDQSLEQIGSAIEFHDPRTQEDGSVVQDQVHPYGRLVYQVEGLCGEQLDALQAADDSVVGKLRELARAGSGLDGNHVRATLVLLLRGDPESVPIANQMMKDPDPAVQWLGAEFLSQASDIPAIQSKLDPDVLIWAYAEERDHVIQAHRAAILRTLKARSDVKSIVERLEQGDPWCGAELLGELGDPSAVPALIKGVERDPVDCCVALRKLATPEAVSLLSEYIQVPGAAYGLLESGSPKALEVVPPYLEELKKKARVGEWWEEDPATIEVGLLALRSKAPKEDLLRIAEDTERPEIWRCAAMMALRRYDCSDVLDRVIAVMYSKCIDTYDPRSGVKLPDVCWRVVATSRAPEATRKLIQLGLDEQLEKHHEGVSAGCLQAELNSRLGTHFFTWKFLHWYLLRAEASQPKK